MKQIFSKLTSKGTAKVASLYLQTKWNKIKADQASPSAAQERAFQKLKKNLEATELGQEINLASAHTLKDYAYAVTPRVHADLQEKIERAVMFNEANVLFEDDLSFVGISSGTMGGKCKKIPFNAAMIDVFENFQTSFAAIIENHTDISLVSDDRLTWGSSPLTGTTPQGVQCGYVSGFLATRSPKVMRATGFPTVKTSCIENMKEKILATSEEVKNRDIKIISAVPTYLINLLEELKIEWGVENFSEIWPNLKTVCYSATSIAPYKDQITRLIGHPVTFLGIYASTEGPIGYEIPSLNQSQNGVYCFHYGDIVYTFRKVSVSGEVEEPSTVLTVGDLKPGDEVEILISSPNGLLQYAMGDVLRIVSVSPTITFEVLGRLGQGLNVATEKVPMSQLQKSVVLAAQKMNVEIPHFFVHPGKAANGRACYEWTLLVDTLQPADPDELATYLDNFLMQLNADYEENRIQMGFLERPIVHLLPSKIFKNYFERESHRGQLKMKSTFESQEKFQTFIAALIQPEAQAV